jgi:hypothetical protein
MLAGLHIGGFLTNIFPGFLSGLSSDESSALFPEAFPINQQGDYLQIGHSPALNPSADGAFLLTTWLNLRRLPAVGERLILLSKYEGSPRTNNGYAIALHRDEHSIRPLVFWGDPSTTGRWYDFPEISLESRQWLLLGLSFSEQKYLGLYYGTIDSPRVESRRSMIESARVRDTSAESSLPAPALDEASDESRPERVRSRNSASAGASAETDLQRHVTTSSLTLLGGYELGTSVVPSSSAPLIIGAARDRHFRGSVGAVGVFAGALNGQARAILSGAMKEPLSPPESLENLLQFWLPDASYFAEQSGTQGPTRSLAKGVPADSRFVRSEHPGRRGDGQARAAKNRAGTSKQE